MKWKRPNTITGAVAEGDKYFARKWYEDQIWREINKSNHVLFLAPRRVGKSSIVKYMAKNPDKFFLGLYRNIQSDSSIQEFYKRLFTMTMQLLETAAWAKQLILGWKKKWKITSISLEGVKIENIELDYREAFFTILNEIKNPQERIVLFLDEFPDVLKKIYERHGEESAISLLDDMRSLRSKKEFTQIFVLVLLGSVGLSHMVKKITGRSDKVNDLHKEYLKPLDKDEMNDFIDHLVREATMTLGNEVRNYLIEKLGHYIPYYIQLIIEECDEILSLEKRPELTKNDIDLAYGSLILKNEHFSDWEERLKKYFPKKYSFLMEVLIHSSHHTQISIQEIFNLAIAHDNKLSYKADLDDILIADGYLFEQDNIYFFNSPLLRDWWKKRHPVY